MLSPKAQQLIHNYFNLPFTNVNNVRCPYFINSKKVVRGQLRVLAGKGTPQEIVEEAKIISIQYDYNIFDKHGLCHLPEEKKSATVKKYLIDYNLGIDCSGFVVHILQAHFREIKNIDFVKKIKIVSAKKLYRYLISRLRPIENIGVNTLYHNTKKVKLLNIKSGDMIIMLKTGPNKNRDHILLVTNYNDNIIQYTHARPWSNEGKYGHGVSQGEIKIINKKGLLKQEWRECNKIGNDNETYLKAKNAKILTIQRLNI